MTEEINTLESAESVTKKKSKVKIIIIAVILAIIVGVACLLVGYFTGDSYKYSQAVKNLQAGNYNEAFEVIYEINPNDALLPFNGLYTCISIGDKRTLNFENDKYTKEIPSSDGTSTYDGTYKANGYTQVILTDSEDFSIEKFSAYKNYLYQCEDEDFVFDEKVDISNGFFNGKLSEKQTFDLGADSLFRWDLLDTYIFEDDGTYTKVTEQSDIGSSEPYATHRKSGTYTIKEHFIVLSPNDKEEVNISFLVIDNLVYRIVYERDYTSDINNALS